MAPARRSATAVTIGPHTDRAAGARLGVAVPSWPRARSVYGARRTARRAGLRNTPRTRHQADTAASTAMAST